MFTVRLDESDRALLRMHFLALEPQARHLRFGGCVTATAIERYVEQIDFSRDAVFGVNAETRNFEGIAHLSLNDKHAELGLSILPLYRRRGIATALVSRASVHARNRQIDLLFMHCLSTNRTIMHIAAGLGMRVVTLGPDSEASITLPSADSRRIAREQADDPIALCDAALRETLLRQLAFSAAARDPALAQTQEFDQPLKHY